MMLRGSFAALLVGSTLWLSAGGQVAAGDGRFIEGRITLKTADRGKLAVGYAGVNQRNMFHSNLAGRLLQPGETRWSVRSETGSRISVLSSDKKDEIHFRHTMLEPGHYLVYARWGDRFLDWRWIEVKADAQLTVNLTLDPASAGRVEVSLAKPVERVQVVPLDGDGKVPLEKKVFANLAYALGTSIKAAGPSPVIDGLRPGRYRVIAGPASADVEIKAGETVSVSPK
jgi:hypothetical protein